MAGKAGAVLITGCSTGIGRASAERLAAGGHIVYATARKLDAIADLEGKGCKLLALDVNDEASMAAAVEAVEGAEGGIAALVNNAGYSQSGAVEDIPLDSIRSQFETNVFGLIRMSQLVLPGMRRRRSGRIVNIGSMGGKLTFPGGGIYHATKYAVEAISDAMRFEVSGFGIQVVLIEPGLIRTHFSETAGGSLPVQSRTGGAYDKFNHVVGKVTTGAYESPISKLVGGGPESVAKVIEKAITTRRPSARYAVTPSAHLTIAQKKVTPDRVWDMFMGRAYPRPGRS